MKHFIRFIAIIMFVMIFSNCEDGELSLQRIPYTGNDIRMDGYYYKFWSSFNSASIDNTTAFFLFRNGIILAAGSFGSINLNDVDEKLLDRYKFLEKQKIGWGVYNVKGNKIVFEQWTTSVGGGLPVYKDSYNIENDTTLTDPYGGVYHFRQFSPKPDSTNNFIK